ncbi:MAG: valine--tRNA ligase [Planctomycetaceae bacterium]|nr:valine--tRNA ligase [Planctomycetaceae bacterium]
MTTELARQYDPKDVQPRWIAFWHEGGYFDANPNPAKKSHTIMIPLPNVTGALHMGHALNGTLQDLITRWRRMQGYEALWMPGTDHAGIATQAVVERRMLEEEGLTRHDIGREALVQRIWKWKDEYEARILNQLKQSGASCDWRRTRFTLDEVCSRAVRHTFFKLFKDGLIYRGKRLVNWDTFLQTAVADDEVFHETVKGHFWTFTYPVVGTNETIAFSTTRPETMLGDTAVAVHPQDDRYRHLVGKLVKIPLNGREIPIIADALLVDRELGTGCVKVTPAHDPNDYACGQRHKMGPINILNPDGTLNENAGRWQGLDRYEARQQVVAEMEKLGHLVKIEDRDIEVAHSDRSKTPVEPYLSDQWFVEMETLGENAMEVVRSGKVKFFPPRYTKTYLDWLGEKRDWCISRQLWWGHRIPIWTADVSVGGVESKQEWSALRESTEGELRGYLTSAGVQSEEYFVDFPTDAQIRCCAGTQNAHEVLSQLLASKQSIKSEHVDPTQPLPSRVFVDPAVAQSHEAATRNIHNLRQDPDVLDTWFSSALWPHETLGWPDLEHNPPLHQTAVHQKTPPTQADAYGVGTDRTAVGLGGGGNEVLRYFYPSSVLITSRDIITLWVARMVIMGLYNMGDIPFRHVHVHPKILDGFGQTMSKSKGNGVDPLDLFDKYGVDAVRFTITSFAGENQDVRLPVGYECPACGELIPQTDAHQKAKPANGVKPRLKCAKCKAEPQYSSPWYEPDPGEPVARVVSERFEYGRNFCNKLWNASRFAIMNLANYTPGPIAESDLMLEDRWILSRLATTGRSVTSLLGEYHFDAATRALRDFAWNEFCDWYIEMLKPRLRDDERRPAAQRMLVGVLDTLLRLLSPFTPFICEELWQRLNEIAPERGLLAPQPAAAACLIASWPELPLEWRDNSLEARFARLQEMIVALRNVRAMYRIEDRVELSLHVRCQPDVASQLNDVAGQFENLAKTVLKAAGVDVDRPGTSASFSLGDADGFIPLEGVVDREAELSRQRKEADKLRGFILGNERKLANESFVAKAPREVVEQVREALHGLKKQLISVEDIIKALGGA